MESPIEPTVGRVVLVHGSAAVGNEKGRHVPALVQRVHSNNCLDLAVMTDYGCKIFTSILYSEIEPMTGLNWFWMPYQRQQAAIEKES